MSGSLIIVNASFFYLRAGKLTENQVFRDNRIVGESYLVGEGWRG